MGTDKRERQKTGRLARAEAELTAARRAKTRRTVVRTVIGVVVVGAVLFGWSAFMGDDDDDGDSTETAATDTTLDPTATAPPTTAAPEFVNPELAEEVLARDAPDPEPPPEDLAADALETETLIEGEGEAAVAGDQLTVHYIGKIPDDSVFDESWSGGSPFPVTIGVGQVIPGWDEGLIGVKIGERRRLEIGSDLAYGPEGTPDGSIPPDTPLAFEVDIVDIQPGQAPPDTSAPTETTAPAEE